VNPADSFRPRQGYDGFSSESDHFVRLNVTAHVPGVQVSGIDAPAAFPVQLCGPLSVTVPSVPMVPVNPSKGAANESLQPLSETTALMPTSV
jgi:hypothetical protein